MTNEVRIGKWMRAAQKGLKMSCIHPFGHHNWTWIIFGNHEFDLFLSHLWSQIGPFGLYRGQISSTWAQNGPITLVCAPQIVQKYLWKNTFLIHF